MSTIQATIVGRLARDPETKTTNNGTTLTSCTIPVDTGWGDNKHTTWWRVTIFGKRAEVVGKHLAKGRWASFTGAVSVREYTKKDGSKGVSAEMTASDFAFVGNRSDNEGGSYGNRGGSQSAPRNTGNGQANGAGFADDDIPF